MQVVKQLKKNMAIKQRKKKKLWLGLGAHAIILVLSSWGWMIVNYRPASTI